MTLYQEIAQKIRQQIDRGVYLPGTRLPGVRRLSAQLGVSISTVVQAQRQLENTGLIEARPRSGYYVTRYPWAKPEQPAASTPVVKPTPVSGQALVLQLAQLANHPHFIHLGAAVPDVSFMPLRALQKSLAKVTRQQAGAGIEYAFPPGLPVLRKQIWRRMHRYGCEVDEQRILVTNGCQEAISLALQAVASPGDIVAIESPTFYGLLQVIETLGMKALEIPTHPRTGISVPALELAVEQWPVKACVLTPNASNPLGAKIPDAHKNALVKLANQHDLMLIEDDINSDLMFTDESPRSLFSFDNDKTGNVIYCSSFSKTISPGLRTGWMVLPEGYYKRAEYLKYVSNLATPTINQLALADYLRYGNHDRHLRQIRQRYEQQVSLFTNAIYKYFPDNTRVTQPQGGFVLWLELPEDVDTLTLSHDMLKYNISIAPGPIFSATQKYANCLRINCAQPWSAEMEKAILMLSVNIEKGMSG